MVRSLLFKECIMLFSLIDPFGDCWYLTEYLTRMIRWAEKLGTTRFQLLDNGKFVCHVQKCDSGEWRTSDPAFQNCPAMSRVEPQEGGV
jgi:hypothetical protein